MENIIWVSNLGRAAALSLKHEITEKRIRLNTKFNKDELQFGFFRTIEVMSDINAYDNGKMQVDAFTFFRALSDLRSIRWDAFNNKL